MAALACGLFFQQVEPVNAAPCCKISSTSAGGEFGGVVQAHLLQALQNCFAHAFLCQQGLLLFGSEGHGDYLVFKCVCVFRRPILIGCLYCRGGYRSSEKPVVCRLLLGRQYITARRARLGGGLRESVRRIRHIRGHFHPQEDVTEPKPAHLPARSRFALAPRHPAPNRPPCCFSLIPRRVSFCSRKLRL